MVHGTYVGSGVLDIGLPFSLSAIDKGLSFSQADDGSRYSLLRYRLPATTQPRAVGSIWIENGEYDGLDCTGHTNATEAGFVCTV